MVVKPWWHGMKDWQIDKVLYRDDGPPEAAATDPIGSSEQGSDSTTQGQTS